MDGRSLWEGHRILAATRIGGPTFVELSCDPVAGCHYSQRNRAAATPAPMLSNGEGSSRWGPASARWGHRAN